VKGDAQTAAQCTLCNSDGDCAQCHEDGATTILFALSTDDGPPRCLQGCDASGEGRGFVPDGESDVRKRFLFSSPPKVPSGGIDVSCLDVEQEQTRVCTDGVFGPWLLVNPEGAVLPDQSKVTELSEFDTCVDSCRVPAARSAFVCGTQSPTAAAGCTNLDDCAACTLHGEFTRLPHGEYLLRSKYKYAFVQPGGTCNEQLQEQQCLDGGLTDVALGRHQRAASTRPDGEEQFTENTCTPLCSADCYLDDEVDTEVCHPECNNKACCYQHGACAAIMANTFADGQRLAFNDNTAEAIPLYSSLCAVQREVGITGDVAQLEIARASCEALQAFENGLDFLGRAQSFVDPLDWTEYEVVVDKFVDTLTLIGNEIAKVEGDESQREQFALLTQKIALVQLSTDDMSESLKRKIDDLDQQSQFYASNIEAAIKQLSLDQKAQFNELSRSSDRIIFFQEENSDQLQRAENKLLDSDKDLLNDLTDVVNDARDSVIDEVQLTAGLLLDGQGALMDAIDENAEKLHQLMLMQLELKQSTLESQRLLEEMSGEYEAERLVIIADHAKVQAQNAKIRKNNGWDVNKDGIADEAELVEMIIDMDILETAGLVMLEERQKLEDAGGNFFLTDVVGLMLSYGNIRDRVFVKAKGLNKVTNTDADLDGDSKLSIVELLVTLADTFSFFKGGNAFIQTWVDTKVEDAARKRRNEPLRLPHIRGRRQADEEANPDGKKGKKKNKDGKATPDEKTCTDEQKKFCPAGASGAQASTCQTDCKGCTDFTADAATCTKQPTVLDTLQTEVGRVGKLTGALVDGDAWWMTLMGKAETAIGDMLGVGGKFSFAKVNEVAKRIKGIISGINSLVKALSSTLADCGAAIGAIVGLFTGGLAGLFGGGGGIQKIVACINGIKDTISAAKKTFDNTLGLIEGIKAFSQEKAEIVKNVKNTQKPGKNGETNPKKDKKKKNEDKNNAVVADVEDPKEVVQEEPVVTPMKKKEKKKKEQPANVEPTPEQEPDPNAPAAPWTAARLAASGNDANNCYIALFAGACGSNGGVYKLSPDWYTSHNGGPIIQSRCGKVVENWPTKAPGHKRYESNLADQSDISNGQRATFESDYVCEDEAVVEIATGDAECFDVDNENCIELAKAGECSVNKEWMTRNCRASCRKCKWIDPTTGKQCYRTKKEYTIRCTQIKGNKADPAATNDGEEFQKDVTLQTTIANGGKLDGDDGETGGRARFARAIQKRDIAGIRQYLPNNLIGARVERAETIAGVKENVRKMFVGEDVNVDLKALAVEASNRASIKVFLLGRGGNTTVASRVATFGQSLGRIVTNTKLVAFLNSNPTPNTLDLQRFYSECPEITKTWSTADLSMFLIGAKESETTAERIATLARSLSRAPNSQKIATFLSTLDGNTPTVPELHSLIDGFAGNAAATVGSDMLGEIQYYVNSLNTEGGLWAEPDDSFVGGWKETQRFLRRVGRTGYTAQVNMFMDKVDAESATATELYPQHVTPALQTTPERLPKTVFDGFAAFLWGIENELTTRQKLVGLTREFGRVSPAVGESTSTLEGQMTAGPLGGAITALGDWLAERTVSVSKSDSVHVQTFVRALNGRKMTANDLALLVKVCERYVTPAEVAQFVKVAQPTPDRLEEFIETLPNAFSDVDVKQVDIFAIGLTSVASVKDQVNSFAERLGKSLSRDALDDYMLPKSTTPSIVGRQQSCEKLGWTINGNGICGSAKVPKCNRKETLSSAEAMCAASNARLCTADEIASDVLNNAGCGFNDNWIWTSTFCGEDRIEMVVSKGSGNGKYECRRTGDTASVECCSDSSAAGVVEFTEATNVFGGGVAEEESLVKLLRLSPTKMQTLGYNQASGYIFRLAGAPATMEELKTLATGAGKVFLKNAAATFLRTIASNRGKDVTISLTDSVAKAYPGAAGNDQSPTTVALVEFLESLPKAYPTTNEVDMFVNSLSQGMVAQNEFLRISAQASTLVADLELQTTVAQSNKVALKETLRVDRRKRLHRAIGPSPPPDTCHAEDAISIDRLLDAETQMRTQQVRGIERRVLELVYKERRQLEAKWLTDLKSTIDRNWTVSNPQTSKSSKRNSLIITISERARWRQAGLPNVWLHSAPHVMSFRNSLPSSESHQMSLPRICMVPNLVNLCL
jgi:hypothetical protein